jgi:hypothetical protein
MSRSADAVSRSRTDPEALLPRLKAGRKPLMWLKDDRPSALTCNLDLGHPSVDRETVIWRSFNLLRSSDWLMTIEIENWLLGDITSRVIVQANERGDELLEDEGVRQSRPRVAGRASETDLACEFSKSADPG